MTVHCLLSHGHLAALFRWAARPVKLSDCDRATLSCLRQEQRPRRSQVFRFPPLRLPAVCGQERELEENMTYRVILARAKAIVPCISTDITIINYVSGHYHGHVVKGPHPDASFASTHNIFQARECYFSSAMSCNTAAVVTPPPPQIFSDLSGLFQHSLLSLGGLTLYLGKGRLNLNRHALLLNFEVARHVLGRDGWVGHLLTIHDELRYKPAIYGPSLN